MTTTDHSTTLPGANRHQLCELAEEWRHDLDLLGPFADDDAVATILAQVPDCCADDAQIVRGWIDGRRGNRDERHADCTHYMSGFWLAVGRNLEDRHGPQRLASSAIERSAP